MAIADRHRVLVSKECVKRSRSIRLMSCIIIAEASAYIVQMSRKTLLKAQGAHVCTRSYSYTISAHLCATIVQIPEIFDRRGVMFVHS